MTHFKDMLYHVNYKKINDQDSAIYLHSSIQETPAEIVHSENPVSREFPLFKPCW